MKKIRYFMILLALFLLSGNALTQQPKLDMLANSSISKGPLVEQSADFDIQFLISSLSKKERKKLYFDVTIQNRSDKARWFIIPAEIQTAAWMQKINLVQVYDSCSRAALAVRFFGKKSYYALLLEPKTVLHIEELPISLEKKKDKINDFIHIEALIAKAIQVENTPLPEWINIEWIREAKPKCNFRDKGVIYNKRNPNLQVLPLKIDLIKRLRFKVRLRND